MGQKWIVNSSASNHIMWDKNFFNSNFYETYNVDQIIQGAGETFAAIGVSSIKIAVQVPRDQYHNITLSGVLHCSILFINLLSVSYL